MRLINAVHVFSEVDKNSGLTCLVCIATRPVLDQCKSGLSYVVILDLNGAESSSQTRAWTSGVLHT